MKPSAKLILRVAGIAHFLTAAYSIKIILFFAIFGGFTTYLIFFFIVPAILLATQGYFLASLSKESERFGKIIIGYSLILLILLFVLGKTGPNFESYLPLIMVGGVLIINSVTMVYLLSVKPTIEFK